MSAKLLVYGHVPLGFEMVIEKKEVKAWNLWWNIRLTDDPEAWDDEIRLVNEMQGRLGELTLDQRLIRAQMAEFCRENPLFPQSIEILCREIGEGRFSKPVCMGCEGRTLLKSLGYHDPESLNHQRQGLPETYARSLKRWLTQARLDSQSPLESKVFNFLGQPTSHKQAFAEKLITALDSGDPSIASLKKLSADECRETYGESIMETRGRPYACFNCNGSQVPDCQCCYSMILDAGLLCAGTFGEQRTILEEYRRFVEESILAYSAAVNAWLNGVPPKDVTTLIAARYITPEAAAEIPRRIHSSLGEKDEAKVWLTACLLKTIKDNQRWHKRTELIDGFPEATSWFSSSMQGSLARKQGAER